MSNLEELNYAIISELRDQLEAKEQMIKELKEVLKECYNLFTFDLSWECGLPTRELVKICSKIEVILK